MKTDRLQIRNEFIREENKPYIMPNNDDHNYTSDYVKWLEDKVVNNINYMRCCVNKDSKEENNINNDKELIDSYNFEEIQLCGKSNCKRPKLEGNVYCSYHYDINFG